MFGAGKLRTAFRVTLPLMLTAILSAALFLFTSMMGAFAIPTMLGTNARFYVATTAIFVLFQSYPPDYPLAAAIGLVLLCRSPRGRRLHSRGPTYMREHFTFEIGGRRSRSITCVVL